MEHTEEHIAMVITGGLFRHQENTLSTALQRAGIKGKVRWIPVVNEFKQLLYTNWGDPTPSAAWSIGSTFAEAAASVNTYLDNAQRYHESLRKLEKEGKVRA